MSKQLIPDYIKTLKTYPAGKPIEELAREKGLTRISKLASNENPMGPSPDAVREMTYSLWDVHRYPDMHCYELKNVLAQLYELKTSNIILANGSEGIIGLLARTFCQPGTEVLTSEKTFLAFKLLFQGAGAKIIEAPMTKDYRYDVNEIAKRITDKTKMIYIANPNNPTGNYITKKEFDQLMESVPKHVLVILDEAYFEFAQRAAWDYPDSMDYRYDNVITLRTFSKAYGLSGIRVGYGFSHEELIDYLHRVKLVFEPGSIAQKGAIGAVKDYSHLDRTLRSNEKRYYELKEFLETNGFHPLKSVCNFITFAAANEKAAMWIYEELLKLGVIIRPLISSGMPEFLRVSLGSKDEMAHFYEAMNEILPIYKKEFGEKK